MQRIIVVGINTEVGKTVVSAILAEILKGAYWKPVQCGVPTDADWVQKKVSNKVTVLPSTFTLSAPCSPHLAAKKEGLRILASSLQVPLCSHPLIIEGTGGLLSPLNECETWADAAICWQAQWILVHRHYLGSLNHFALTIESMRLRKIPLIGVIFNGQADEETELMLLKQARTSCIGRLPWPMHLTKKTIQRIGEEWKQSFLKNLGV